MKKPLINSIIFYFLFIIILSPFVSVILFSFSSFEGGEIKFGSLIGYLDLFEEKYRFISLYSIFSRAFLNASFAILIALPFSYIVVRSMGLKTRLLILIIMTLPFFINEATRVFSWNFFLGGQGIINTIIQIVNPTIKPISWLSNSEFSVRIAMLATSIPFAVFVLTLVLSNIKRSVWTASQDLGASNFYEFFKIAIPLSKVGLVASGSLVFLFSLSMATEVLFLGGASKRSLRLMINDLLSASKISAVMALGTTFIIFIVFLFLIILLTTKLKAKKD